jgi:hypothetical protein
VGFFKMDPDPRKGLAMAIAKRGTVVRAAGPAS